MELDPITEALLMTLVNIKFGSIDITCYMGGSISVLYGGKGWAESSS